VPENSFAFFDDAKERRLTFPDASWLTACGGETVTAYGGAN